MARKTNDGHHCRDAGDFHSGWGAGVGGVIFQEHTLSRHWQPDRIAGCRRLQPDLVDSFVQSYRLKCPDT